MESGDIRQSVIPGIPGGTLTASGAANQVAVFSTPTNINGYANLTFVNGTKTLTVGGGTGGVLSIGSTPFVLTESSPGVLQLGASDVTIDMSNGAGFAKVSIAAGGGGNFLRLGTDASTSFAAFEADGDVTFGLNTTDMAISCVTAATSVYSSPYIQVGRGGYIEVADNSNVALVPGSASGDNQADLGRDNFFGFARRWRTGYFGTSVVTPLVAQAEIATPAAPADGSLVIYAKDAGAGKTGLYVLFPSGAEQQIKVEA